LSDITINGGALTIFSALLGSVVVVIPFLFKKLVENMETSHAEVVKAMETRHNEVMGESDKRYESMKDDRDFHRGEAAELRRQQAQALDVLKDGVAFIRVTVERLAGGEAGSR
jgi:hypothetical protein